MSYMKPERLLKRAHVTSAPPRTGLDDGPPLPSPQALERAYAKIERSVPRTDAERMNWLEKVKYAELGLKPKDGKWQVVIRLWQQEFHGRSIRSAIDAAMRHGESVSSIRGQVAEGNKYK